MKISRREMLRCSATLAGGISLGAPWTGLLGSQQQRRFKLGACDWSIGKMGDPAAFEVAKEIGLDGVQVSLGTAMDNMRLRQSQVQEHYKEAARKAGAEIASLAIGELNNIPYKSDPR